MSKPETPVAAAIEAIHRCQEARHAWLFKAAEQIRQQERKDALVRGE